MTAYNLSLELLIWKGNFRKEDSSTHIEIIRLKDVFTCLSFVASKDILSNETVKNMFLLFDNNRCY